MTGETFFPSLENLLAAAREILGENLPIRDVGLLESAVARCVAHGISLADIAEVAEISRSLAKQLADRQGKLDLAEPLTEVLR
ncbi:hypothetical protein [Candidatus Poriferisocius sp.]|uniref:hypothetical protein n=1 Tax=Candidatus Poriferisocius sp. TaxID=3101276 RepID=UPI003B028826